MSLVLMVSMVILLAAVVLIEFRAIREGDERRQHAPGYALVMGGLVMIGIGIAAAMTDEGFVAVLVSLAGLLAVALAHYAAQEDRGQLDRLPNNANTAQAEPVRHLFRTGSPLVCENARVLELDEPARAPATAGRAEPGARSRIHVAGD